MADNTYAISHIVGTSPESLDTAIRNGLARAGQTVRHLDWFEVDEIRGELADEGQVNHFQVVLRVGFRMED
ncbi:MAG: dodecin family protein [Actinobacteria bacterium QS_5_72_10]|nr:MAG: dodecin family protein [Actinobacteria bacterium QS_8_72_14]PSO52073.1 MAG: dodecin family protein [Actinobacteria bacterium QS_5_72_10]